MSYKKYEAYQVGYPPLATSKEELTNYYKCKECGGLFKTFNDHVNSCKYCGSYVDQISDFDYMSDLKNSDIEEYKKELKLKKEREDSLISLVDAGKLNAFKKYRKNIN